MNLNKPLGIKSIVIALVVTFFVIYFATKIGLGASTDRSGINDGVAFFIATFATGIVGAIVGVMAILGKKN